MIKAPTGARRFDYNPPPFLARCFFERSETVHRGMLAPSEHAVPAAAVAGSPATPGGTRARAFGQPRRSSSLNASIDALDATCSKCPAASAQFSEASHEPEPPHGCNLAALATASLALGMMSPPAFGAAAPPAASALGHRGEPTKLGQSRSQPMLALRSLPATEVTKHPGVKNALKVRRLPRSPFDLLANYTPPAVHLSLAWSRAQMTLFDY